MSDKRRNILETAENIDYYGEANSALQHELPFTAELFAANRDNIGRLNRAGVTSASAGGARRSGTRSKVARFAELESDLRLVVKTARLLEKTEPGFRNTFTIPRGALNYDEGLAFADAFQADAPAFQAAFAKYGLTAEFFAEMAAAAAEFRSAAHEQADAQRTGVGATAEQEAALEATLATRRQLDRAIRNHYRDDPQKLAEWLTASHIRQRNPVRKGSSGS
ncbi:MAG: hypothetical protein JSS81_28755 [Acidobacteria bacterium]|nr:hypothetical protein [Acidobacteriota bacterium]